MPAKDIQHDIVREALLKDGWTITEDPLFINFYDITAMIDLEAERILAAKKQKELIAVEIKSFISPSIVTDFHAAIGQYIDYRTILKKLKKEHKLYLAINQKTYEKINIKIGLQILLKASRIKMLVIDEESREIIKWIK